MPTPFHLSANCHHHSISDLAYRLRRTNCSSHLADIDRSISRRKKGLPDLTTLHACANTPIRESSSLLLHAFLPRQISGVDFRRASFSGGSRSSIATESSSTPVKEMVVAGPSSFSGSYGKPVSLHVSCIILWFRPHSCSPVPPVL